MVNSKQKGARGERNFANWLRDRFGFRAKRGVQYQGSPDSPDIIGVKGLHFEVKRVERLNLHDAMAQAICECGENIPVVAHRRNRGQWMITILGEDVERFVSTWQKEQKKN